MGVVHLAAGAATGRGWRSRCCGRTSSATTRRRERLAREVASLRRVTSPRVAEVIDADPWGQTPYVATRYVPGPVAARARPAEGPVTGADLTHLAAGLAEAVIAVHQVGVLHRDIKPSNVLLEGRVAGAHRLRAGPARRGPAADPDGLAARDARLPGPRDPLRRRRDHRLRRALVGRDDRLRRDRAPAVRHAVPRWRSWTGCAAASTTCPGCPRSLLPLAARLPGAGPRRPSRDCRRCLRRTLRIRASRRPAPSGTTVPAEVPRAVAGTARRPPPAAHRAAAPSPTQAAGDAAATRARAPYAAAAAASVPPPPGGRRPRGCRGCSEARRWPACSPRSRSGSPARRTSASWSLGCWRSRSAPSPGRRSRPASGSTCAAGDAGTTRPDPASRRRGTSWSRPAGP